MAGATLEPRIFGAAWENVLPGPDYMANAISRICDGPLLVLFPKTSLFFRRIVRYTGPNSTLGGDMSNHAKHTSRRSFLHLGAGAAAAFSLSEVMTPLSFGASSNRTVVCIYLVGGNDSNNLIVPLDSPAYGNYARGRGVLGLSRSVLLPVQGTPSSTYGFHPSLPGLRDLYNQNAVAVVANVGRVAPNHMVSGDAADHAREMQLRYLPNGYLTVPWAVSGANRERVLSLPHSVSLAAPDADPVRHSGLVRAVAAASAEGGLPDTVLGRQMSTVLSALKLGAFRQHAFLVPFAGFETNRDQLNAQAALFTELDDALVTFYRSLRDLGLSNNVTIYTDTEFNRTLAPNKSGGSDHAWGGHHLVLGALTLGGQIYGSFPSLEIGGADDVASNGTWTPSTSSSQYAATLAYWYGVTDLADVPEYAASAAAMESRLGFLMN